MTKFRITDRRRFMRVAGALASGLRGRLEINLFGADLA
jgi:hypothetical protein